MTANLHVGAAPTRCPYCRQIFESSLALQAEARHIAAAEGARVAEMWLNNKLTDRHKAHL